MFDRDVRTTVPSPHGELDADLMRKVAFLSDPASYTPAPGAVTVRETHMSWVFMAGKRVYKLKKPVRFAYLDFSTLERRAAACWAEDRLNRRLAPDVYLGVMPLTVTTSGYALAGGGYTADWLVVMRRLDERDTLEAALHDKCISRSQVARLAAILNHFYIHAARSTISPESYLRSLGSALRDDILVLSAPRFALPAGLIGSIAHIQARFLAECGDMIANRVHRRFIVEGHGDLRPEHIWLSAPYPIIDCLEFDARLRTIDALSEVAFLHLECERLGARWVGEALLKRLACTLGAAPASALFLFYRISRAMLRARLSIAHLADPHPRTPEKWPRLTRGYLTLAHADAMQLAQHLTKVTARRRFRPDSTAGR